MGEVDVMANIIKYMPVAPEKVISSRPVSPVLGDILITKENFIYDENSEPVYSLIPMDGRPVVPTGIFPEKGLITLVGKRYPPFTPIRNYGELLSNPTSVHFYHESQMSLYALYPSGLGITRVEIKYNDAGDTSTLVKSFSSILQDLIGILPTNLTLVGSIPGICVSSSNMFINVSDIGTNTSYFIRINNSTGTSTLLSTTPNSSPTTINSCGVSDDESLMWYAYSYLKDGVPTLRIAASYDKGATWSDVITEYVAPPESTGIYLWYRVSPQGNAVFINNDTGMAWFFNGKKLKVYSNALVSKTPSAAYWFEGQALVTAQHLTPEFLFDYFRTDTGISGTQPTPQFNEYRGLGFYENIDPASVRYLLRPQYNYTFVDGPTALIPSSVISYPRTIGNDKPMFTLNGAAQLVVTESYADIILLGLYRGYQKAPKLLSKLNMSIPSDDRFYIQGQIPFTGPDGPPPYPRWLRDTTAPPLTCSVDFRPANMILATDGLGVKPGDPYAKHVSYGIQVYYFPSLAGGESFSLEFWFKLDPLSMAPEEDTQIAGTFYRHKYLETNELLEYGASIKLTASNTIKISFQGAEECTLTSNTTLVPDVWYHMAFSRKDKTVGLFHLDGILQDTRTIPFTIDGRFQEATFYLTANYGPTAFTCFQNFRFIYKKCIYDETDFIPLKTLPLPVPEGTSIASPFFNYPSAVVANPTNASDSHLYKRVSDL